MRLKGAANDPPSILNHTCWACYWIGLELVGAVVVTGRPLSGRAGGLRPEPVAQSQPEALIPDAFTKEQLWEALCEAVYVVRNVAGVSEWHRLNGWRHPGEAGEDFCVWAGHWEWRHRCVEEIGSMQDAQAIEARRAATLGAVHESAVPEGDAP